MRPKTNGKLKLFIDSSDNQKTIIKIGDFSLVENYDQPSQQKILTVIDKLLKQRKLAINQIGQITVNTGPGSYTGLRVGCAVANALAWGLGIKVNGKKSVEPKYE